MEAKIASDSAVFRDHQEFFLVGPAETTNRAVFPLQMLEIAYVESIAD